MITAPDNLHTKELESANQNFDLFRSFHRLDDPAYAIGEAVLKGDYYFSRFSQDFLMNDVYFYSAMLYTIWTGKCFRKDEVEESFLQFERELEAAGIEKDRLVSMIRTNLRDDAVYVEDCAIPAILKELAQIGASREN